MAIALALLATWARGETPPAEAQQEPTRPSVASSRQSASAKPDPLAERLCDVLHALPAKRRQECCRATLSNLTAACAQSLSATLQRGAVTLDASGIDRCAEETLRELKGCDWVTPLPPKLPDACAGLIQGNLRAGAACRSSLECVDGLFCRGVSADKPGVCSAPAAARTRCETPADNLATFTRARDDPRHPECEGRCVKGQCLPFTAVGGACHSSIQCARGLHCISGSCQDRPLPKVGESCAGKTACDAGAYCKEGQCAALKDAGAPCSLAFECRAFACVKAPGSTAATCADPCGSTRPR